MKLDAIDKKILFELDHDSRQSYRQIARKARCSKEVVAYRIKRLGGNGVIFRYLAVVDPAKLGYSLHKVMLKLENTDVGEKRKIIEYLKNHPYSLWVVECDGPFDVGLMLFSRTLSELNAVLTEISNHLSKYINQRIISTNIVGEYFSRRYLIETKAMEARARYGERTGTQKIDEIDWQILLTLSEDARSPLVRIAEKVPIGIDAISERIRKLETTGVLGGYSVILNNNKMGQYHYKILIYLKDLSESRLNSIREFCSQHNNIVYLIKSLGVWDLEIDLEVESPERYREIMLLLMKQFPDTIRKYDALQIYRVHQYRYLPNPEVMRKSEA